MLLGQPLPVVAAAAAIVAAASALQATVGFGLALLAIPLLHLIGFEPPAAIAISSSAMLVQMANGVLRLRASVQARELLWPLVITMATMVLGVLALRAVVAVKPDLARQAAGVVVLGALVVLRVVRPAPRPRVAAPWTVLAMSASGLLSGSTGMGGPAAGALVVRARMAGGAYPRHDLGDRPAGDRGAAGAAGGHLRPERDPRAGARGVACALRPGRIERRARPGAAAVGGAAADRRLRGAGRVGRERDRPPAAVDAAKPRRYRRGFAAELLPT